MEPADKIERAWKNERKWFSRTFVASFVSVVCFFGTMGVFWWGNSESKKLVRIPISEGVDQAVINRVLIVGSASLFVLVASGLAFLYFLIRWLIALKVRRSLGVRLPTSDVQA